MSQDEQAKQEQQDEQLEQMPHAEQQPQAEQRRPKRQDSPEKQYRKLLRQKVKEISDKLGENDRKPMSQIKSIIERCGLDFSLDILRQTFEIEENGGMMISDGSRRRTPGGVFFQLCREQMQEEDRLEVFMRWRTDTRRREERESKFPVFVMDERQEILSKILNSDEKGEVTDVKVNLSGRPGEIERRQNLVITTMQAQIPENLTFPTGVPQPLTDPMNYVVYIGIKHWEKVEKALNKGDDELVIEGLCLYDPDLTSVSVYATYVTTKNIQRKEKQRQSATDKKGGGNESKGGKEKQPKQKKQRDDKPAKPAKEKAPATPPTQEVAEEAVPEVEIVLPEGLPPQVEKKLIELHRAATSFRHKIAALESKPPNQQFGLELTQKLLKNTERQIAVLEDQYAGK